MIKKLTNFEYIAEWKIETFDKKGLVTLGVEGKSMSKSDPQGKALGNIWNFQHIYIGCLLLDNPAF